MANSIAGVNQDIVARSGLNAFVKAMTPISAFATNFSSEAAQSGDKISVWRETYPDEAALTKTTHSDYTIQDADSDAIELTLGQPVYVSFGLDDTELAQNPPVSMEAYGRAKGNKLATKVLQDIWGLLLTATYTDEIVSTAGNFDADDVADLRAELSKNDAIPMDSRMSLVLSPDYVAALLKDAGIQGADSFGSDQPIREGVVGRLMGFDVYESNVIPANGENLVGFACVPDAIAVAMRYLQPQEGNTYFRAEPLVDPGGSGITCGLRDWYDNDSGTRKRVMECVYGYAAGLTAGLIRIVSS